MKTWICVALMFVAGIASATPISHVFSGIVTSTSPGNIDWYHPDGDRSEYDWWPDVGDRYHGVMTFDSDLVIREMPPCYSYSVCSGLIFFEMALGDRIIKLKFPLSPSVAVYSDTHFISSGQVIGTFDSFDFQEGSFSGVEASYFGGMTGEADVWVQVPNPVPEPMPLVLAALSLLGLVLQRLIRRGSKFRLMSLLPTLLRQ